MSDGRGINYHRSKLKKISRNLTDYFAKDEGVKLGESSVVSCKVHMEPRDQGGTIHIYQDKDAGIHYLKLIEKDLVVHIDVLHTQGDINANDLASRIRQGISAYLSLHDDEPGTAVKDTAAFNLAQRIFLKTSSGEGSVLNPEKSYTPAGGRLFSHVHLLAKLPSNHYGLIYFIVEQTEKAIIYQGYQLRSVKKFIHYRDYKETSENFILGIPATGSDNDKPLEVKAQNSTQVLLSIAFEFGSIEIAEQFLELISPLKVVSMARLCKRYPRMERVFDDLEKLGYVKKEAFGYSLTSRGQSLKEFFHCHKKALSAQIRKAIRHIPNTPGVTPSGHFCKIRSRHFSFYDKTKSIERDHENWYNPVAIPETVVRAAKRSFIEEKRRFRISTQDLQVYRKKSKAPVDICMVVDCSGSMKGSKFQAVRWLAEYLVLTTKDKVSLVSFQERDAKVVIPFTRSYSTLHTGLLDLEPEGLTPLAKGLAKAIHLITMKKPKNPLIALITDGKPNTPLFGTDALSDAINLCKEIPKNKIRFIIIGIDPAREFIPKLALAGQGNYYLVDDIDKSNLVTIMKSERNKSRSPETF